MLFGDDSVEGRADGRVAEHRLGLADGGLRLGETVLERFHRIDRAGTRGLQGALAGKFTLDLSKLRASLRNARV